MIDLNRFETPIRGIVPILGKNGVYCNRKFTLNVTDGWYELEFTSNIKVIREAYGFEVKHKPTVKGCVFGNEFVPQSFDVMEKKFWRRQSSFPYYLGAPKAWTFCEFLFWEDGNFYFKQTCGKIPYELLDVQFAFNKQEDIKELKGVTPELRYLFFLYNLERRNIEAIEKIEKMKLEKEERKRLYEKLKETSEFRVKDAIEDAGGKFIKAVRHGGDKLEVIWEIAGDRFNSLVDVGTFQVLEAGLCVSREDKKFNIKSLVLTVNDFIDEDKYFERNLR